MRFQETVRKRQSEQGTQRDMHRGIERGAETEKGCPWLTLQHYLATCFPASARRQLLFAGHLANYQSRGTFAASEQMSIYGDGVFRDHLAYRPVDAQYAPFYMSAPF